MLTARTGWAQKLLAWFSDRSNDPGTIRIREGEIESLWPDGRALRVLSGTAWLAMGGRDYILKRGERIMVDAGREKALLSAVGKQVLRIDIT